MQVAHLFDGFDLPILSFLTGFAGRSPLFDHLINALSRLDIFKGVALMCLFWYTWAEAPADEPHQVREQRQKRLVLVLIGTVLIGGLSRVLQLALPIHQRPLLSNLGLNFPVTAFDASSISNWNSFPSDHSMFFFALGAGLWTVNRTAGVIAFAWTIVIIDFPRVYLGLHYPTDIIFGALFGVRGDESVPGTSAGALRAATERLAARTSRIVSGPALFLVRRSWPPAGGAAGARPQLHPHPGALIRFGRDFVHPHRDRVEHGVA